MKYITTPFLICFIASVALGQTSFISEARENTTKTIEKALNSITQSDLKHQSLEEFKTNLSRTLITSIASSNKEILANEYEVINYLNNVGPSIKDVYQSANCLVTLSTPSLVQSALETECTTFKARTLEIIVLRWKEILIEYKDLKKYDGMISANTEIRVLNAHVSNIVKEIESLVLLMEIYTTDQMINIDEIDQLKKYLLNTLKSAEAFVKLSDQIEFFLNKVNYRLKETEMSLRPTN